MQSAKNLCYQNVSLKCHLKGNNTEAMKHKLFSNDLRCQEIIFIWPELEKNVVVTFDWRVVFVEKKLFLSHK